MSDITPEDIEEKNIEIMRLEKKVYRGTDGEHDREQLEKLKQEVKEMNEQV